MEPDAFYCESFTSMQKFYFISSFQEAVVCQSVYCRMQIIPDANTVVFLKKILDILDRELIFKNSLEILVGFGKIIKS